MKASERSASKLSFNEFARRVFDKMSLGKIKPITESKRGMSTKTLVTMMQRNLTNLFIKNAYIFANGCMMIWSVLYHSWLGFVLLVWANLIWISKNQRQEMMKSSFYLVAYALCLLIIGYIYGMDFTDTELPANLKNINMIQIGLIKYASYPGFHLLIKSACTVSFWITNRLMVQERIIAKHKVTRNITDNVRMLMEKQKKKLKSYAQAFLLIEKGCVFSFMWIIVLLLFLMGITGGDMTLFRIVNMCFSLIFFLMFHFSLVVWTTTMHTFWWALIVYSTAALIVTYVYQFDSFQGIIFLKKFGTKLLFIKLLSFSLVIFLTGLQINKFQNQFMTLFERTSRRSSDSSTNSQEQVNKELSSKI